MKKERLSMDSVFKVLEAFEDSNWDQLSMYAIRRYCGFDHPTVKRYLDRLVRTKLIHLKIVDYKHGAVQESKMFEITQLGKQLYLRIISYIEYDSVISE